MFYFFSFVNIYNFVIRDNFFQVVFYQLGLCRCGCNNLLLNVLFNSLEGFIFFLICMECKVWSFLNILEFIIYLLKGVYLWYKLLVV